MATLQELKKKHKSIKSTQKLTKAMKTVSAAKYSRLNGVYGGFTLYSDACFSLYEKYSSEINSLLPRCDTAAPSAVFVFSSNKGMCGGFNTELFSLFSEKISEMPENTLYFPCGKKAVSYFTEKKLPFNKEYIFSDIPSEAEVHSFLEDILEMRKNGEISSVFVIYPEYKNVMKQLPVMKELFRAENKKQDEERDTVIYVPDKMTVMKTLTDKVLFTLVYAVVTGTALGAQASTLTTMRSAYDTAVKYSAMLEIQINRKRQSEVTADVIETTQA